MRELQVGKNDAGQRLDRLIQKSFPLLPNGLLQKYIRTKQIKLNKKRAHLDDRVSEGDLIALYVPDDLLEKPTEENAYLKIKEPVLNILYEDENLLLLDKPAGLLCHSDDKEVLHTLVAHVQAYLYQSGAYKPGEENAFAPALCNRIDRNTGGIVLAAKNAETLRILNEKIRDREIDKYYLCLVHGKLSPPNGMLEGFLLRDEKRKQVSVSRTPKPGAKTAKTVYRTLRVQNGVSLVECLLLTGRTHQIRAQMAETGHPLIGDGKYGVRGDPPNYKYQALYSYKIQFNFKSDAGLLNYLNGTFFEVPSVPFV